jgi:molecular chaperone GrpE
MQKVILGSKSLIRRTLQITEQNSFFIRPLSINSFRWQSTTSNGASSSADGTESSSKVEQNVSGNLSAEAIKIKELQTEIDVTKKKVKELSDDRIYQLAEMENVRRIASIDVKKAKEYACQPMAKGLLLALDNLESALRAAGPTVDAIKNGKIDGDALAKPFSDLVEGLQATERIFVKVIGEHGTTKFGTVGDKFDATRYDAMSLVPPTTDGQKPGHVQHVIQSGYNFKDRVLRPCQCFVVDKASQ